MGGISGSGNIESADRPRQKAADKKLEKACADFEAIFISYMFKNMRSTIPESGLNNFPGKDLYNAMIDQKVAEDLAERGGIGIKDSLIRQLNGNFSHDSE